MNEITLVIADDHPVVRGGLRSLLSTCDGMRIIGEAADTYSTLELLKKVKPDILLLDMKMPGCDGISLIHQIKQQYPELKIIVLTIYDDKDFVCGAIEAGVQAYILKSLAHEEIINTILAVHKGEMILDKPLISKVLQQYTSTVRENSKSAAGLSEEDIMLLMLASKGLKNKDIAEKCHWSEITVKHKFQTIYSKLEVSDRTQAVAESIRRCII
ncbi:MAG TPA: response regulator transcription factor [Syntrophomonadaceae bacterium]|nr:response regulator transcription factor [Syntrophomonadaceae bacterium]